MRPCVANFGISQHFSLSFNPHFVSQSLCSFNYIVQGLVADIWVLHRGTWTWVTAGHTSHTSLTHTLFGQSHERELWEWLLDWQCTTQLGWKSERNVRRVSDGNRDRRMEEGVGKVSVRKGRGVGNAKDKDKVELKGWMDDDSCFYSSMHCGDWYVCLVTVAHNWFIHILHWL